MDTPTYKEQFDKITRAYIADELDPGFSQHNGRGLCPALSKKNIMKTTEKINNEWVVIDGSFEQIQEKLDHNWADWSVKGEGSDGKLYWGNCQASTTDPQESHDVEIYYLEETK